MTCMGPVWVMLTSVANIHAKASNSDLSWLGPEEVSRYNEITASRRKIQFLSGRRFARECLAKQVGGQWDDYVLSAPDNAPPFVLQQPSSVNQKNLHISLSHSGDYLACAVATRPIGVDIENTITERDWAAMSSFVLTEDELASVGVLPVSERCAQFYARWTLKEAWIKQDSTTSSMRAVQCFPCDTLGALGMVMSTKNWTLAVTQVEPENLILCDSVADEISRQRWQVDCQIIHHK